MRHWGTWLVGMDTKPLRAVCALVGSRREKEGEDPVGLSLLFLSHSPAQHGDTLPPVLTSPHPSDQASVSSWVIKCQTSIVHGYWGHSLNWVYVASWFPGDCWYPPLSWTVGKMSCDWGESFIILKKVAAWKAILKVSPTGMSRVLRYSASGFQKDTDTVPIVYLQ